MTSLQNFEVKYETAENVPPPYSYYYHLFGQIENKQLHVNLEWVYLHREDLTLEEIQEEGFTGQDDFNWKGEINPIWINLFESQLIKTKLVTLTKKEHAFLEVKAEGKEGNLFKGEPQNKKAWEYFMQEFIQAIFEASGKETPLTICFKKIEEGNPTVYIFMHVLFDPHTIEIHTKVSDQKEVKFTAEWEPVKKVIQQIYQLNIEPERAITKEPTTPGTFLDIGEGAWYQFSEGLTEPTFSSQLLQSIEQFFMSFKKQ